MWCALCNEWLSLPTLAVECVDVLVLQPTIVSKFVTGTFCYESESICNVGHTERCAKRMWNSVALK